MSFSKVNIIYQFENSSDTLEAITWFPFYNQSCGERIVNVQKIEECTVTDIYNFTTGYEDRTEEMRSFNQEMYPIIPRQYHRCDLRAATILWEPFVVALEDEFDDDDDPVVDRGLEVLMLKTIAQFTDLNLIFQTVNRERASKTITADNKTGLYSKLLQR
jgi:hypothetical protein